MSWVGWGGPSAGPTLLFVVVVCPCWCEPLRAGCCGGGGRWGVVRCFLEIWRHPFGEKLPHGFFYEMGSLCWRIIYWNGRQARAYSYCTAHLDKWSRPGATLSARSCHTHLTTNRRFAAPCSIARKRLVLGHVCVCGSVSIVSWLIDCTACVDRWSRPRVNSTLSQLSRNLLCLAAEKVPFTVPPCWIPLHTFR